ncbi:MAG: BMC domain-containing protein [Pseudobutyrivibrio sp.]|nr:BMC domain-containing protein [Pseudobutyrivibrio sp.]
MKNKGTSYGLIEVSGVTAAIDSLDAMCKAADVSLVTWERKLGGRLVTIIVEGTVSNCTAAVDAACAACKREGLIMASYGVIANPADETRKMVALSASRKQHNGMTIAEWIPLDV